MRMTIGGSVVEGKALIPWAMAAMRGALGPAVALGAAAKWNGMTLVAMVLTALLSDIFDGVLARLWKCDTAAVRRFDSYADRVFYLGAAWALWLVEPMQLRHDGQLVLAVLGLEGLRCCLDYVKYGATSNYHSYLAKTWGLLLAGSLIWVLGTGQESRWFTVAMCVGLVCQVESIAMTMVLPVCSRDIKTLGRAFELRRTAMEG